VELPEPEDLTSLVIRTDFSDDAAWQAVQATIDASEDYPCATYVNDPAYANVDIQTLIDTEADQHYVFLAGAPTMTSEDHQLLVVDLAGAPGRTFRVPQTTGVRRLVMAV
jgi:hypothetical protein